MYQTVHEISHAIIIDIRLIYFLGAVVSFRYVELSDHSVIQCVNSLRLTECEMECLASAIEKLVRGCVDAMNICFQLGAFKPCVVLLL